jgi:hypothetical protein
MSIEILDQAEDDLIEGFHFYEAQRPGLVSYFLVNLYEDIDSSASTVGAIVMYKDITALSKRFPFAVSTSFWKALCSYTQSRTVVAIQPGSGSD